MLTLLQRPSRCASLGRIRLRLAVNPSHGSTCLPPFRELRVMLAIQALRKSYPNPEGGVSHIVDIPHFSLASGEQVALRGESGSGKTTFLHLIAGILSPDTGVILVDGVNMASLN